MIRGDSASRCALPQEESQYLAAAAAAGSNLHGAHWRLGISTHLLLGLSFRRLLTCRSTCTESSTHSSEQGLATFELSCSAHFLTYTLGSSYCPRLRRAHSVIRTLAVRGGTLVSGPFPATSFIVRLLPRGLDSPWPVTFNLDPSWLFSSRRKAHFSAGAANDRFSDA